MDKYYVVDPVTGEQVNVESHRGWLLYVAEADKAEARLAEVMERAFADLDKEGEG